MRPLCVQVKMNCEECQQHLSVFLDNELDSGLSAAVQTHLALCPECAKLCADFAMILETCGETSTDDILPPNSQALWCRINNIIETEIQATPEPDKKGWFSRGWSFTFSQVGAAAVGIVLISVLLTIVGLRNYFEPTANDFTSRSTASQTTFEKVLSKVGLVETPQQARERRFREQQVAIDYWTKRVALRRAQWDGRMRDAFDRNLYVIDESVSEYNRLLQNNPDDELSGEMLDAVMTEKMNLLRAFSDL